MNNTITCLSSGPLLPTNVVFDATDLDCPFLAAMKADLNVGQVQVCYPSMGYMRDYRRATVQQVCDFLRSENKLFITDTKA